MIDEPFAQAFAADWIAAWNRHDLDAVLAHYVDDMEFSSPVIAQFLGRADGVVLGKNAVRDYWAKALAARPDLRFELQAVMAGVTSLVICYQGVGGRLAAEFFEFGDGGKVLRASAHYVGTGSVL